jgi:hypothetical protein
LNPASGDIDSRAEISAIGSGCAEMDATSRRPNATARDKTRNASTHFFLEIPLNMIVRSSLLLRLFISSLSVSSFPLSPNGSCSEPYQIRFK